MRMGIYPCRYVQVYLPRCTYMCPHVHTHMKTMKMLMELFLFGYSKFRDDRPIGIPQIQCWSSYWRREDARDGLKVKPGVKGQLQPQSHGKPTATLGCSKKSSCCCGRCCLLHSALVHSIEDQKEGDKEKMRKATCRGRWWGGNRKLFSKAV